MKRTFYMAIGMLMAFTMHTTGKDKKPSVKDIAALVVAQLQKGEALLDSRPAMIVSKDSAADYCRRILTRKDEDYSRDTAQANAYFREVDLLTRSVIYPDPKTQMKLLKKQIFPERIAPIVDFLNRFLYEAQPLYDALKKHCNAQLELRRQALSRKMPEGKLVELNYEESGGHLPVLRSYKLLFDKEASSWKLNGNDVTAEVVQQVVSLAEKNKAYQCLSRYDDVPSTLQTPVEGGPPAYSFSMKFEGGCITTCSENKRPPSSIQAILNYLQAELHNPGETE